ncbi:MAG: ankyrin repeat domain-containing protein [bacterium]|nr:ankyrin repeat domain-containing protein [bacterium]
MTTPINISPQAAATFMKNSIRNGNIEALGTLLFIDKLSPNAAVNGSPMLHEAAKIENDRAISMLLQAGAEVNGVDGHGHSPLRIAIKSGNGVSVKKLLAAGADPMASAREDDGTEPTDEAIAYRYGSDVAHAVAMAVDRYRINDYVLKGKSEELESYLKKGVEPDTFDRFGKTALMEAVEKGAAGDTEVLLKHKADPNIATSAGETAMHIAAAGRDDTLIEKLYRAGGKMNVKTAEGLTPLQIAERHGNRPVMNAIRKHLLQEELALATAATRTSKPVAAPKTARFGRKP